MGSRTIGPARPPAVLLRPPAEQGMQPVRRPADTEKTGPHRSAALVGAAEQKVTAAQPAGREASDPLGGVTDKRDAGVAAEGLKRGPRLQHSGFIGGGQDGDPGGQTRGGGRLQRGLQGARLEETVRRNGQAADPA